MHCPDAVPTLDLYRHGVDKLREARRAPSWLPERDRPLMAFLEDLYAKLTEEEQQRVEAEGWRAWPVEHDDRPPSERIDLLTDQERAFAARLGLEHGIDDDDEDLHQGTHVCWPYESGRGALCKTSRLWGHTGPLGTERKAESSLWQVDCEACATRLRELMRDVGPVADLLDALGGLAGACQGLTQVSLAAHDLCWALDNPEEHRAMQEGYGLPEARQRLDEALAQDLEAHAERMKPPAGPPAGGRRGS